MAHRVCPWWLAFMLNNPLRRLWQDPGRIVRDYIRAGQTVVDVGCGPGYFSIPMARMVGPSGRVVCIDVQRQMLEMVARKARKHAVQDRVVLHQSGPDGLGWLQAADFVLAFAVVHEVPDQRRLMAEIAGLLRSGGRFLLAEPRMHVAAGDFDKTVRLAEAAGLKVAAQPSIRMSRSVLLQKPAATGV